MVCKVTIFIRSRYCHYLERLYAAGFINSLHII